MEGSAMKTAGIIVGVLVLIVAGILIYAATKPDTLVVQRSATIKAAPDKIFALINDFGQWAAWSPYEKKDPAMKRTRSGPAQGKGAVYAWDGNKDVGKGRMEIADTQAPAKVTINLDFEKPFAGHNTVTFSIEPKGDAVNVTWHMQGKCPYIAKVIGVFINMDDMVGKDFEAGLAAMRAVAEKGS
jgi:carbon monoxide dehydrogenase subunit G